MFPCLSLQCPTCPYSHFIDVLKSLYNSLSYPICYHLPRDSSSIIYVIGCSSCGKRYVGQTHEASGAYSRTPSTTILHEYFRTGCDPQFFFFVISHHRSRRTHFATKGAAWIVALNTIHPRRLNSISESEPHPPVQQMRITCSYPCASHSPELAASKPNHRNPEITPKLVVFSFSK